MGGRRVSGAILVAAAAGCVLYGMSYMNQWGSRFERLVGVDDQTGPLAIALGLLLAAAGLFLLLSRNRRQPEEGTPENRRSA